MKTVNGEITQSLGVAEWLPWIWRIPCCTMMNCLSMTRHGKTIKPNRVLVLIMIHALQIWPLLQIPQILTLKNILRGNWDFALLRTIMYRSVVPSNASLHWPSMILKNPSPLLFFWLARTKNNGLLLSMVIFNIIFYLAIGERAGLNLLNHASHDFPFNTGQTLP